MGLIWSQSSKIPCPRNQQLQGHSIFSLGLSNNCYWVCLYRMFKHTQVPFLPECSFKICERPSKFAVGARTLCPCEANNFFGMCQRSQPLVTWTQNLKKNQIIFFVTFVVSFFSFSNVKLFTMCHCSRKRLLFRHVSA